MDPLFCAFADAVSIFSAASSSLHLDKYIVRTIETWALTHFSDASPFAMAFWLKGGPPSGDMAVYSMAFAATTKTLPLGISWA